jgi:hypothetical protein
MNGHVAELFFGAVSEGYYGVFEAVFGRFAHAFLAVGDWA